MKLGQGRLAAETIGLALNLCIDGAVGLYFLAGCEAHRAHLAVLGHIREGRILVVSTKARPVRLTTFNMTVPPIWHRLRSPWRILALQSVSRYVLKKKGRAA